MPPPRLPASQPSQMIELHFPLMGIDLTASFDQQPNRPTPSGMYARTTALARNVRGYETGSQRARGGTRPALARHIATQVSGQNCVQGLSQIVGVGYNPPGGSMQLSQSGRVVTLVAVSNGDVRVANAGDTVWTTPTNGNGALTSSGLVFSAPNQQKLWFADGVSQKYYDPSDNTVHVWTASAGSLPVDGSGNKPRLICTWRGRTVLSGLIKDAQNIFFSKVGDPTDFDYSPVSPSAIQAVALNSSPFGLIGDAVMSLLPFTDDVLVIGTDHQIWMLQGDPADGGQMYKVSDGIGMAWGMPYCVDPYGQIYFFSNRTGIYQMTPGQPPNRISQQIEQLLQTVNTGANSVSMAWDDRFQGFHLFVTPLAGPAACSHLFWEARTHAWWLDVFGNNDFNPLCCCTFDGNTPGDRVVLIGSWDGFVRYYNKTATDDDGVPIDSAVTIGPILTRDMDDIMFEDIQPVLGETSGDVTYNALVGRSAESALASSPVASGTWAFGRNLNRKINRNGHALFVKITATGPWSMEAIRARVKGLGKIRQRGK